jgi:hypothetical protein
LRQLQFLLKHHRVDQSAGKTQSAQDRDHFPQWYFGIVIERETRIRGVDLDRLGRTSNERVAVDEFDALRNYERFHRALKKIATFNSTPLRITFSGTFSRANRDGPMTSRADIH